MLLLGEERRLCAGHITDQSDKQRRLWKIGPAKDFWVTQVGNLLLYSDHNSSYVGLTQACAITIGKDSKRETSDLDTKF